MISIVITATLSMMFSSFQTYIDAPEKTIYADVTARTGATDINQAPMEAVYPVISFDRTEYDFGKMTYKGQPKSVKFKFKNTGDAPLVITRTELSCTCLSVEYPRKPVMKGEEGFITVTYTPKKETGKFNNTVKIFSNSADRKPAILFLRVEVTK